MKIEVFLEYKFGDYDLDLLVNSGITGVIAGLEALNENRINELGNTGLEFSLSFSAFVETCPFAPGAQERLIDLTKKAVQLKPKTIWLDHLRFPVKWKQLERGREPILHEPCPLCVGKNRVEEMIKIVERIRELVLKDIKLGYYAVPFKDENLEMLHKNFGQNQRKLCQYFDEISPMLYHRMVDRPVGYISEFVKYLTRLLESIPIAPP